MIASRFVLRQLTCNATRRMFSAEAAAAATEGAKNLTPPPPEGVAKPVNPKLESIANSIAGLNLLEVSELSALLKSKLNLPETSFVPQMAMGPARPAAAAEEEEEAAPKKVQTSFKVKLVKFDEKQKVALIKEVKNLLEGMNLVQAKKFVESAPTVVKDDIPKDEAEKLKEALTKAGAVVEIE
ncbi:large ribosomal subunit protein bL12m [Musca domestica]|uniref:39S ribosomal protein L12, mitochondrial n=2 Tax=Musca domestica TaxID=7370 RepID=A0A1I8MJI2_MUSDO|nr:large ribosomal subunit protein bL12m [Musca domestica]